MRQSKNIIDKGLVILFGWFQMLRGILFFRASRQILAQADA